MKTLGLQILFILVLFAVSICVKFSLFVLKNCWWSSAYAKANFSRPHAFPRYDTPQDTDSPECKDILSSSKIGNYVCMSVHTHTYVNYYAELRISYSNVTFLNVSLFPYGLTHHLHLHFVPSAIPGGSTLQTKHLWNTYDGLFFVWAWFCTYTMLKLDYNT